VAHRFLLEAGSWSLDGYWLEKKDRPSLVRGMTRITWKQENWFTMVSKLALGDNYQKEIFLKYKGHLDNEGKYYTYVLQHSLWGRVEGEGWIGSQSIVQCYWVIGTTQRQTGFETFSCLDENNYHFSSGILVGHHLKNMMELTLKRLS
jgi:hypothetical protein